MCVYYVWFCHECFDATSAKTSASSLFCGSCHFVLLVAKYCDDITKSKPNMKSIVHVAWCCIATDKVLCMNYILV